jgi:hypothetical protein
MNYGNGPIEGYDAPLGSYARPMSAQRTANWVSIWEMEAA